MHIELWIGTNFHKAGIMAFVVTRKYKYTYIIMESLKICSQTDRSHNGSRMDSWKILKRTFGEYFENSPLYS